MGRVAVVTDSSTCLPAALAEVFGIRVLPISANLPEDRSSPDADLAAGTSWPLSEAAEQEELTGANRPFVTEYLAAVAAPAPPAAVLVTPAVEFAAMFRNASLAAELADRPAVAVDARTAAAGQALVVLAGAEEAATGADLAAVVAAIEDASRRVELVASLETLGPLRRSGPVPDAVLGPDDESESRSVFRMRGGTIEPLGSTGSAQETLETIRQAYIEGTPGGAERSTVFHAGAAELAERLEAMIGPVDFVSGFSASMQVHTGQGVVGVAWLAKAVPS
ncbi:MAG: DegV family protein [Acidimicrobiales bacterium]